MDNTPTIKKRQLKGVVTSDAMDKTCVVLVERAKKHPRYEKIYTRSKKFKAHDEENKYHVGDRVVIQETRPYSKDKRWVVVELLEAASAVSQKETPSDEAEIVSDTEVLEEA
jgi:small subunit ribosomal protein S17